MTHEAGVWVDNLAKFEIPGLGTLPNGRFFSGIIALVASGALHIHQLLGKWSFEMTPMEGLLRPFIGVQGLIPGQGLSGLYTRRRLIDHPPVDNLLMTA